MSDHDKKNGISKHTVHRAENTDELLQLVTFNVSDEEFAINIVNVKEINRIVDITRVPNVDEYIIGVINLRGKVIPIIDLRKKFGMQAVEHNKSTRIVVVEQSNHTIGFIVDCVNEVLRINKNITEQPPQTGTKIDKDMITAIAKLEDRLLILLDLDKLFIKDLENITKQNEVIQ